MQKLVILVVLMVGLLLTFPMQSGATPICGVNDEGQTTCVVNVTGRGSLTDYYPIDVLPSSNFSWR